MNDWAIRRKRIILSIVLCALVVLFGVPLYFILHAGPTCSDGVMNGDETGVDCGGSCKLVCRAATLPLLADGDPQVLKVSSSTYEVVVQVENPNPTAAVLRAPYTMKIYPADDAVPLKIISASTYVPKASKFVVFEGPFDFGSSTPTRATFEWGSLDFVRDTSVIPELDFKTGSFSTSTRARLLTAISNPTLSTISNIEVVVLVADEHSNIVAAGKTFVDALASGETSDLVFAWKLPFVASTTSFELFSRVLPDKSYIR